MNSGGSLEGLEPSDRVVNLVHYSFSLSLYMSCHKRWLANGDSSDEEAAMPPHTVVGGEVEVAGMSKLPMARLWGPGRLR